MVKVGGAGTTVSPSVLLPETRDNNGRNGYGIGTVFHECSAVKPQAGIHGKMVWIRT
ncbi:hypothetical protein JCM16163A_15800 [Paenibacillus sp. YK5]|nr:hypothetical protein PN4B1_39580 [Paenibacillus naphthalenovorans]